jgi:hypothetical protein
MVFRWWNGGGWQPLAMVVGRWTGRGSDSAVPVCSIEWRGLKRVPVVQVRETLKRQTREQRHKEQRRREVASGGNYKFRGFVSGGLPGLGKRSR